MMFILIISGVILLFYVLLILFFNIGWGKIPYYKNENSYKDLSVSVIISVRNEQENILSILSDLNSQNYSKDNFQVIIVNDHSEDNTRDIVLEYIKTDSNFSLLNLPKGKFGKKDAIIQGVNHANGELILTTDADCRVNKNWIATIVDFYQAEKPKMIISPVVMKEKSNFFQKAQTLEFISLIGSGAGAIGLKHPIMCNGANLAYEKSVFKEKMLEKKFVSGEDVFLLHNLKKEYRDEILFLKNKDAIVQTNCLNNAKEFLNQRIRWQSKSKSYFDRDSIIVSLIVFFANSILLLNIFLAFSDIVFLYSFLIFFFIKTVVDLIFFIPITKFFKKQNLLMIVVPVQFFYIFYVTFIPIISGFIKYNWKNRQY